MQRMRLWIVSSSGAGAIAALKRERDRLIGNRLTCLAVKVDACSFDGRKWTRRIAFDRNAEGNLSYSRRIQFMAVGCEFSNGAADLIVVFTVLRENPQLKVL